MKFLRSLFLTCASIALGLAVGAYLATNVTAIDKKLLILIAGIVCGVGYLIGIILAIVVAHITKQRKNLSVNLQKNDLVLQCGVEYVVKKRGTVRPGEYAVLATDENNRSFTLRVNNYVKEYQHNTNLILSEGDTISARSSNVILR
ncbi:MAG: hypothetical protein IKT33_02365 [Clostridia bacterium]|nr:hypothetical protein [Clostridia bacterium]